MLLRWPVLDCLFCGKPCIADKKHPERRLVFNVTFLQYREIILNYCCNRRNDKWSGDVKRRVFSCNDLVDEEARYQDDCRKLFTHPKNAETSSPRLAGRPRKEVEQENFFRLCEWLKCEGDSFSVVEMHEKMKELAKSNEIYSLKWFKPKLFENFKDLIYFSDAEGKSNVLCFKHSSNSLINDGSYKGRKANNVDEVERIVIQAAKIILGQIRCTSFDIDTYLLMKIQAALN